MRTAGADLRFALRTLARNPGFAGVALVTIGLGVGANTAVFSVIHAALVRPLPYPESDRVVAIHETVRQSPGERRALSYPTFLDWQRGIPSVDQMAAHAVYGAWVESDGSAQQLEGARVSWNYFRVLGVRPAVGRDFAPEDDTETAAPVMVISDGAWTRLFGRDPSAIGRVITVDGMPCTVIGVMPPDFAGPPDSSGIQDEAETWTPIGRLTSGASLRSRAGAWVGPVIARLRPGVTTAQVQAELDAVTTRLAGEFPESRDRGAVIVPLSDQIYERIRPSLVVLFGSVGLVLLAACVNVASLLLSRATSRQRELAVRRALGASRWRIARLLLTESLVIALAGGALGLLLAAWMVDALLALSPEPLPRFVHVGIDLPVLSFTLLLCVAAGLAFGMAPALAPNGVNVHAALKAEGYALSESGSPLLRRSLVAAEIAGAVVVLVGSGLMLRTLERLRAVDAGFDLSGIVAMAVLMPVNSPLAEAEPPRYEIFARSVLERVSALPAVRDASLSWDLPLISMWAPANVRIDGAADEAIAIIRHPVTPGYFRTLGVPLIEGRDIEPTDIRPGGRDVVVISRHFARTYWPSGSPLGQRLLIGQRSFEIVGVVGDVRHFTLLEPETSWPDVYFSLYQYPIGRGFHVVVRAAADPGPVAAAIREAVRQVSPTAPVLRVRTGEDIFAGQIRRQRFMGALMSVFALVVLALAVVGIYGVTAYHVGRQTRQIGIRVALGATRADVLRLVVGRELTTVVLGVLLGIVAAVGLSRALATFVFGVGLTDGVTYGTAALLLALTGVAACLVPARRAATIDPLVALRSE
jgi:predicted permease